MVTCQGIPGNRAIMTAIKRLESSFPQANLFRILLCLVLVATVTTSNPNPEFGSQNGETLPKGFPSPSKASETTQDKWHLTKVLPRTAGSKSTITQAYLGSVSTVADLWTHVNDASLLKNRHVDYFLFKSDREELDLDSLADSHDIIFSISLHDVGQISGKKSTRPAFKSRGSVSPSKTQNDTRDLRKLEPLLQKVIASTIKHPNGDITGFNIRKSPYKTIFFIWTTLQEKQSRADRGIPKLLIDHKLPWNGLRQQEAGKFVHDFLGLKRSAAIKDSLENVKPSLEDASQSDDASHSDQSEDDNHCSSQGEFETVVPNDEAELCELGSEPSPSPTPSGHETPDSIAAKSEATVPPSCDENEPFFEGFTKRLRERRNIQSPTGRPFSPAKTPVNELCPSQDTIAEPETNSFMQEYKNRRMDENALYRAFPTLHEMFNLDCTLDEFCLNAWYLLEGPDSEVFLRYMTLFAIYYLSFNENDLSISHQSFTEKSKELIELVMHRNNNRPEAAPL